MLNEEKDNKKGDDGQESGNDNGENAGYPNISSSGGYVIKSGCWNLRIDLFKRIYN